MLRISNEGVVKLVSLLVFLLSAPVVGAQQMSAPIRLINYDRAFKDGAAMPKWQQGHLLTWSTDTLPSNTAENIALFDRDGSSVGKTRIWLPDASLLRILDAAARKDGSVAAVGYAMTDSGVLAGFLAEIVPSQGAVKFIRTSPFEWQAVTFGPDGTIWVLGLQTGEARHLDNAPDHYMVQHFDTDGVLKDEHIMASDFPCAKWLSSPSHGSLPQMVASGDRVGLFAPACRLWIELNPSSGEILGQWKWQWNSQGSEGDPKGGRVALRTVTLTTSNDLYARLDSGRKGFGLAHFDRKTSSWNAVETAAAQNAGVPFAWLEGSDGDALVYLASGSKKLVWSNPTKDE